MEAAALSSLSLRRSQPSRKDENWILRTLTGIKRRVLANGCAVLQSATRQVNRTRAAKELKETSSLQKAKN